jgi:dihydrofolate reductase
MIRLIAAVDRRGGIAKQGFQPWYIPQDEAYFTAMTKQYGAEILVGGITYRTFKGPLAERKNYILTRDDTPIEGAEVIHKLDDFLASYSEKDLWVVGGANVFAQVMELGAADELYLTYIDADFGCNQFFPTFDKTFQLAEKSELHEENGFIFTYAKYVRNEAT